MAKYNVDEFLGLEEVFVPLTLADEVDKKINLLYDLCILCRRRAKGNKDAREEATRQMLLNCRSLIRLDNTVHGIIVGKYTLDQMLERKGYLQ